MKSANSKKIAGHLKNAERFTKIIRKLESNYPRAKIALNYSSPLQLLVAVILSAQCTDKRVNMVTPSLFREFPDAEAFANADIRELEQAVRSTGFYRNKAKNIRNACKMIISDFNGKVPDTMEQILQLPGVARKTANVVLGNAFGIIDGIAVDTHVARLSKRMGVTKNANPVKIEQDLMRIIPRSRWLDTAYLLIEHGRAVCKAPTPLCSKCPILQDCPRTGVNKSR
ncbi:MAG: endonuclease III [archaeon GW2011_AR3]|nr:MAG: endonuclease III [archaeon GW2011_AR3]MBS3109640.1 endonuclease III [Candidatus Woesearchaeota archaeon]